MPLLCRNHCCTVKVGSLLFSSRQLVRYCRDAHQVREIPGCCELKGHNQRGGHKPKLLCRSKLELSGTKLENSGSKASQRLAFPFIAHALLWGDYQCKYHFM